MGSIKGSDAQAVARMGVPKMVKNGLSRTFLAKSIV